MKILSLSKIKLTTALLALALCATDATAMNWVRGCLGCRKKQPTTTALLALAPCATDATAMEHKNPAPSSTAASTATTSMAVSSSSSAVAAASTSATHDDTMSVYNETKIPAGVRNAGKHHISLYKALYGLLNPMLNELNEINGPNEPIEIILNYLCYKVKSECVEILNGNSGPANCEIQLTDGNIASGSRDNTIKIWNLENGTFEMRNPTTGECVKTLSGHTDTRCLVVQLTDSHLASGLGDITAKIWDLESGKCDRIITGDTGSVLRLIQLVDGTLPSGPDDKTITTKR
jgi:WD40 repeat protein